MDHRRTVGRRAFVPPVWLITVAVAAVVAGIIGIGWLAIDQTRGTEAAPEPSPSPSPTASASPAEPSPTPEPTEVTPSPTPSPEPVVDRSPGVSILNGTSIQGLAATAGDHLQGLGWDDIRTGDTGGTYPENTVYFPAQFEEQAATLAADLGITRVVPRFEGLRTDRLTVVLVDRPSSLP